MYHRPWSAFRDGRIQEYNRQDHSKTEKSSLNDSHPSALDSGLAAPASGGTGKAVAVLQEALQTLFLALVVFALVRLVVQNYRIEGPSMQPNLLEGQFLIVNRLAYRMGEIKRGDIVVFEYPDAPQRDLIKRVVGLPGEQLEIVRGQVWIDGQPLEEPYVSEPGIYSYPAVTIPADHVFVMGDNRNNSNDSRRRGPLPTQNIVGKAIFCYWPSSRWGPVAHESGSSTADA